jgi:branched-chain amino acid transport system substrate-binding protein
VLDTIENGGNTKEGFIEQLFQTKDRDSVLGTYSIDENGDTTLTDYGLYEVGEDGNPKFVEAIKQEES